MRVFYPESSNFSLQRILANCPADGRMISMAFAISSMQETGVQREAPLPLPAAPPGDHGEARLAPLS